MAVSRPTLIRSTALLALSAALAAPAFAQAQTETPAEATAPQIDAGRPAVGAQNTAPESQDEIIVTGSSIRGAPPVGSNLIAVGRAEIEETAAQSVQQILKTVPAVTGLGSVGQGGFGSADGAGTNAPTIHGLGASASNSTLVLIDGHRIPLGGINHTLGDPNMVPAIAIERVEVLADGASATYGSDAVAGVINFITRRRYDGVEGNAQVGFGDNYRTWSAALLAGTTWDTGSVMVAYQHSFRDNLRTGDRDFTARDHRRQGGSNLGSFACSPASVSPAGQSLIFLSPYNQAGIVNAQNNAPCDYNGLADLIPQEQRDTAFAKVTQEIGDKLTLNVNGAYANRRNKSQPVRGTVQATVFGPGSGRGSQINPFYTQVAGSTATSQTIRFDTNDLLGEGARTYSGQETFYLNAEAQYKLDDNWRITALGVIGFDNSRQQQFGQLCVSCAYLALNGTTNAAGSLTTPSIPGTTVVVTQALTAANALDVYNLRGSNRTSAAVRAALTDSTDTQLARQSIKDAVLKMDGSLFSLPAGDVKVAFGGELIRYTLRQDITRPNNTGPAATGSSTLNLNYNPRSVESAFVEALIPVIGPDMEIPGVQAFDINVSGRYDHYNDFGSTKNPKIAANWTVIDGLKLRGNYAESFVAPALTSRGSNEFGITGESGFTGSTTLVNIPTALFPGVAGALPGCAVGAVTCQLGGNLTPGIQLNGGNAALRPQDGKTYSFGADVNPGFLPGFRASVTYWYNKIRGGVTAPQSTTSVNIPGLANLMQIFPAGATQAQISAATAGLAQTGTFTTPVYFIYNFQQRNVLNLDVSGIDFDFSYRLPTDSFGTFSIGGAITRKLKFDQSFGDSPKFSVLGTTGFNTTFPSVKTEGRANVGWAYEGFSADFFWNYTGRYNNYSGNTVVPIGRSANGLPSGSGGDKVKSQSIFDLNLSYTIPQERFEKIQVFVDVQNLFDKTPVFYNSNNGYDTFTGNPLKRVITVGLRTAL